MEEGKIRKFQLIAIWAMIANAFVFLIGLVTAIIFYPGYSFTEQFISQLGIRFDTISPYGDIIVGAQNPEIMNITFYLTGILFIPFFPAVASILREKKINNSIFFGLVALTGITLGPLLFLVGVWDVASEFDLHVQVATNLMFMIGVTSILWAFAIISLSKNSFYKKSKIWLMDLVMIALILFVSWVLVYGKPNLPVLRDISYPLYQKLVPITFILYFSIVAYRILGHLKGKI
jgi:hypothetical protein